MHSRGAWRPGIFFHHHSHCRFEPVIQSALSPPPPPTVMCDWGGGGGERPHGHEGTQALQGGELSCLSDMPGP